MIHTPLYNNLERVEGELNNKGTSKRQKTDEKSPILRCKFLHQYLIYIDVVPDVVIWVVNWLHCLNYEAITCSSSTRN